MLSAVLVLIVAAPPARAADDPMQVVKTVANQALEILRDNHSPLKERQEKLREIANAHFDFARMSRLALGYHWRDIDAQQRGDFTRVFTAFIQDSYLSKMQDFSVNKVDFVRQSQVDPGYAQVFSNVVQPGKQPVPVNYMLEQKNGRWLIYDVTVDNISIIANYRNQFNRVINRQGFGSLMADLRSKHDQLAAQLGTRHARN
jgi:phospholipid transport system substrate-binding protein